MLSRNYRPSPKLEPYIRRYYVFDAELPDDFVIDDGQLAETAFVRCMISGDWRGGAASDELSQTGRALFFGASSVPLHVRSTGSFRLVGFSIRPSGWHALFNEPHNEYTDKLMPLTDVWGDLAETLHSRVEKASSDEQKIQALEEVISQRLDEVGNFKTDAEMAKFEVIARQDSTIMIKDAADQVGLSVRQLERRCNSHFGLSPKAVLRRSRFLDMAAAMRGFSSPSEQLLAELRYFDQSHLNKEFKHFAQMTPKQFKDAETPLMTAGLKLREESRYET